MLPSQSSNGQLQRYERREGTNRQVNTIREHLRAHASTHRIKLSTKTDTYAGKIVQELRLHVRGGGRRGVEAARGRGSGKYACCHGLLAAPTQVRLLMFFSLKLACLNSAKVTQLRLTADPAQFLGVPVLYLFCFLKGTKGHSLNLPLAHRTLYLNITATELCHPVGETPLTWRSDARMLVFVSYPLAEVAKYSHSVHSVKA